MKTLYHNTKHRTLVKVMTYVFVAVAIALCVLQFCGIGDDIGFFSIGWFVLYTSVMTAEYFLRTVTVDDERRLIYERGNEKYPISIDEISYLTYKESKRGRFRSLFIHDSGLKFMDVHTSKTNADALAKQLLALNPSIEVRHANYF